MRELTLAEQYAAFKVPSVSGYSKAFLKTMLFANEVKLTNTDIDFYMNQKPMRQDGESSEELKSRSKFSKVLLKYRPYLYDYSVFEKQN
jgi:hypothetical protein